MKLTATLKKGYEILTRYIFFVAPLVVLAIFLTYAKIYNLAPIGEKSVSWCDMDQQVVPLLNMFKDVLEGKKSFTYDLASAGGMSFFGVFFFFLSTPLSFLVVFVDKANMLQFVNVLLLIKMMLIALTSSLYLRTKYKKLNNLFVIAFALLFTFSGYVMMYYQNNIWLDVIIMFPLLMLSCDRVLENKGIIPYIVTTAITVMINYYLGIIVMFFIVLYMAMNIFSKRKEENIKQISTKFIIGSVIAACISMCVLIPSFIDYVKSARTTSIMDSLKSSWVTTSYVTTIPLILGTLILIPLFFIKGNPSNKKSKIILLILLSIPLIIDPINKMWHFGSYQSFPCRFAFINTFLFIDIASMSLDTIDEIKFTKINVLKWSGGLVCAICAVIFSYIFEKAYIDKKINDLNRYPSSLWGNTTSFEALLRYYAVILIFVIAIFILYKTKFVSKRTLGLTYVSFAILETMFAFRVYVVSPSKTVDSYKDFYELSTVIDDADSFYRVKWGSKYRSVNDLSALGYNSLAHYTSLTREDYMNTHKKLGYSSYWMEVGPYGGSIFTDALMMNKYTIYAYSKAGAKYSTKWYSVLENEVLPLGIVTSSDLSKETELNGSSRSMMQEHIYETLIDSNTKLHTLYEPDDTSSLYIKYENDVYSVARGNISYSIDVTSKQTIYFEAFDQYTTSLGQSINETMSIYVNGRCIQSSYPSQSFNGSVELGTFENSTVNVSVRTTKAINCSSFSVFGIDNTLLEEKINTVKHADMKYENSKFVGTYTSENDGDYIFLPISYNEGLKAKVNGHSTKVYKVYGGLVAVQLEKGTNTIEVYATQKGLVPGILISLVGVALLVLYIIFVQKKKKINLDNKIVNNISYYVSIAAGVILFIALYIVPVIINVIGQIK